MARELFTKTRVFLLLCLLAAPSCVKDDPGNGGGGDGAEITFSIKLPGVKNPSSRALDADDEERVETADVYVFDRTTQKLVDIGYGRSITPDNSTPGEIIRNFSVTLQKGSNRDVMVVTNARGIIEAVFSGNVPIGTTKDEFRESVMMRLPATGWNAAPGSQGYVPIPMWGEKKNVDIDGATALTGTNSVRITRMTARLNVSLAATLGTAKFKMSSVRVYNYNSNGLLVPADDATDWQDDTPYAETPSLPLQAGWKKGPILYDGNKIKDDKYLKGEIYLFEATKGVNPADGDFSKNPCLVIGGHYDGSSKETFYRIDIVQKEDGKAKYLHILRNNSYNITILDVNGPGKENEEEAYNTLPVNIDAEVVAWNDHDMNEHLSDGQYQLTVDKSRFLFYDEGRGQVMKLYTDYPYGWKTEIDPQYAWLSVTPGSINSAGAADVEIKPGDIRVNAPSVAVGDTLRYSFRIIAGSMSKEIFIEQVNEPELTLEIEPEILIFRKSARQAKPFNVTTYPAGIPISFSEVSGDIVWRIPGFPDDDPAGTGSYQFHPDFNDSDPAKQRNSSVAVTVRSGEKLVTKIIQVIQRATDWLFDWTPRTPFPAAGGQVTLEVTSETDWWVHDKEDTQTMISSWHNTRHEPGTNTPYVFSLYPNNSWSPKTAKLLVTSSDDDFPGDYIDISQEAQQTSFALDKGSIAFGAAAGQQTGSVQVTSNAQWKYTVVGGDFDAVLASASPAQNVVAGTDSPGANPSPQTVVFYSQAYPAGPGTPAATGAGTPYSVTLRFETTNHAPAASKGGNVTLTRAVPSHFGNVSAVLTGNGGVISKAANTARVTAYTNNAWSVSTDYNTGASQSAALAWNAHTLDVAIPANDTWKSRTVDISYWGTDVNGVSEGIVASWDQPGHTVGTPTLSHSNIAAGGEPVTVSFTGGDFPDGWIEVRATGTSVSVSDYTNSSRQVTLNIPNNGTGGPRSVQFAYRRNGETNWTDITPALNQPKGNVVLTVGAKRVVALNDAGQMNWPRAMGISETYLNTYFWSTTNGGPTMDNAQYTPTALTGCNAYSEPGYLEGTWRVPTWEELQEMLNQGTNVGLTSAYYWSSTEVQSHNPIVWVINTQNGSRYENSKSSVSPNVRCVRAQ